MSPLHTLEVTSAKGWKAWGNKRECYTDSVSALAWVEAAIIQIPNICRKWKSLSHVRLFAIPWDSPGQNTDWVFIAPSSSYKLHANCFRNMCRTTQLELEGEGWVVTTEIRARIDWNEPQVTFQDFPWKLS